MVFVQFQQSGINVTKPAVYTIYNATFEDAGKYTCLVTNDYGKALTSAWITVVPGSFNILIQSILILFF